MSRCATGDPVSGLVVCRQRLDVLEQQAKAAEATTGTNWRVECPEGARDFHGWPSGWEINWDPAEGVGATGRYGFGQALAEFWVALSPAAVLAWVGWIRQTLDGAEQQLGEHVIRACLRPTDQYCGECGGRG